MTTTKRYIRVLVYEGTSDRIAEAIEKRGVKGSLVTRNLTIREAVLGDFLETFDYPLEPSKESA